MSDSKYWFSDPNDPDAPVKLRDYRGMHQGSYVEYTGTMGGMRDIYIVDELVRFGQSGYVTAVLDYGKWEVNADNLRLVEKPHMVDRHNALLDAGFGPEKIMELLYEEDYDGAPNGYEIHTGND